MTVYVFPAFVIANEFEMEKEREIWRESVERTEDDASTTLWLTQAFGPTSGTLVDQMALGLTREKFLHRVTLACNRRHSDSRGTFAKWVCQNGFWTC